MSVIKYLFAELFKKVWVAVAFKVFCVLGIIAWAGFLSFYTWINHKKTEILSNPVKYFVNNISKYDIIYKETFEILKECNADGIFAGIFIYTEGKGKFVDLHGIWHFTDSFNMIQHSLLQSPSQIKDINIRGMIEALKYIEKALKNSNTKYTNFVYQIDFTNNSKPCKLDESTNTIFKQEQNLNTVIDYYEHSNYTYQTSFIRCIVNNLELPQFNQALKQLYIYPIKITGADYMFLTLSSTNKKEGVCFSKDLKKQKLFFEKIEKIVAYQLKI